jgi:hypothetical protein
MVNWKITAATIYCEDVDDEVTLLVYKDGTARCTAIGKYGKPDKETAKAVKAKGKSLKRQITCKGGGCSRVSQYRDRIFAEEPAPK